MFRYALRTLGKNPAWALAAVSCLAIGIGATTTVYTVMRAIVIAPVPTADSDRLGELIRFNPGWTRIAVDGDGLAFAVAISLVTALVVGAIPALVASRADPQQTLKEGGRSVSAGGPRHRLRSALVVGEIALALVLLVSTGLMVRSFVALVDSDQGYDTDRALTMQITLPSARYATDERLARFYSTLLDRVRERPGVRGAALTSSPPPSWDDNATRFILEGEAKP